MKARFKYRIYPKPHQIELLAKAFGCARVVWNDALAIYTEAASNQQPFPKDVDKLVITQAKKTTERAWLSEVSNIVLQQSFRDLQTAWSNYFSSLKGKRKGKKVSRPKFKKKQSRQTIRFRVGGFSVHSCSVKIAKIGQIKMEVSRLLPSEPSSVTIIKDTTERYFASFVVELNPKPVPQVDASVGIDLGLNHFAILSNGEKVENPRHHKNLLKRIKKANRKLSKCKKGSKRREVAKLKLAKLHAKVKDARNDFLQKLTTKLVRENQALAIEDLNVSGMVKNRKLSRAISDAGWHSFRSMLTAKCDRDGRQLVVIDRWEATSQKCSHCGFHGGKKELSVREWTCLNCGALHDRDINAANKCDSFSLNRVIGGRLASTR
jgi:putative transposase